MTALLLPSPHFEWYDSETVELTELYPINCACGRFDLFPGLRSDGMSIPRILWTLVGPKVAGNTMPAALLHDILYGSHYLPRQAADVLLFEVLRLGGMRLTKAAYIYRVLRAVGWRAWSKPTRQEQEYSRQFVSLSAKVPAL